MAGSVGPTARPEPTRSVGPTESPEERERTQELRDLQDYMEKPAQNEIINEEKEAESEKPILMDEKTGKDKYELIPTNGGKSDYELLKE